MGSHTRGMEETDRFNLPSIWRAIELFGGISVNFSVVFFLIVCLFVEEINE